MTKASINSSVDALREQLRAQAEAALHDLKSESPFADKIATAIKEVAKSQEASAKITKAYELGVENDLSKVMISQQISSLGFR